MLAGTRPSLGGAGTAGRAPGWLVQDRRCATRTAGRFLRGYAEHVIFANQAMHPCTLHHSTPGLARPNIAGVQVLHDRPVVSPRCTLTSFSVL